MSFLAETAEPYRAAPSPAAPVDKDWWRGAVIYQIYPRSFQDSNNDGIGDLSGIIHRMDYIAELGVDAIWISPFFRSPMRDYGYDVSSYRDVDPMFGSLGDFDALVSRAHDLGLKVLIDLVLSHTSEEHRWFKESRASRDNPKADWYVWADPKPDGTPPNNWLSIFGGSAWEWDAERMQYYLHNFLAEQPDLNFHSAEVQHEVLDVARFWLNRGVDGFRLDTVNFYFHDRQLRDNPPLDPELRNDNTAPSVNPYNFQDHLHDKTQPENIAFIRQMRALLDEYPATTSVGEVGESQRGTQVQAEYTAGEDMLHMAYDFDFLASGYPAPRRVAGVLERFDRIVTEGWACWAYSNHDVVRHPSRWNMTPAAARAYAGLLLSLKGSVCLYQGEELGLNEAYVPYEDLRDPYGIKFWPKFKGRDGCRTPMPWSSDAHHGGFTDGHPWLPVALEHLALAVNRQEMSATSTLAFYRAMIAFRKGHAPMLKGGLEMTDVTDDGVSFIRSLEGARVFCSFNLSKAPREVPMPPGDWRLDEDGPFEVEDTGTGWRLPPWQAAFAVPRN